MPKPKTHSISGLFYPFLWQKQDGCQSSSKSGQNRPDFLSRLEQ
jgi:hypothetical protein